MHLRKRQLIIARGRRVLGGDFLAVRVYLAGPGVFRPDAERFADELRALCGRYGLEGLWPAEGDDNVAPTARGIFEANIGLIRSADAVIADISPFRGPHVDDGTAWEIGFAYALGKPVFAWTNDPEPLAWRIDGWRSPDGHLRDREGYLIEDFAAPANLMIVETCHSISVTPDDAVWAAAKHFRTWLRTV